MKQNKLKYTIICLIIYNVILLVFSTTALASLNMINMDPLVQKLITKPENLRIAVILLTYNDSPELPFTKEEISGRIFSSQLNAFYQEQSYGKIIITGDVYDWETININNADDCTGFRAYIQPILAKINLTNYDDILILNNNNICKMIYAESIGKINYTVNGKNYTFGTAVLYDIENYKVQWEYHDFPYTWLEQATAHEVGHTIGLGHSNRMECNNAVIADECTMQEYGNKYDTMGNGRFALHFSAWQKEKLGWLKPNIDTVIINTSGTYTLTYLENFEGVRGAKIMVPGGSNAIYAIEYRKPVGFDQTLAKPMFSGNTGLFVSTSQNFLDDSFALLDMSPTEYAPSLPWNDTDWYNVTLNDRNVFFDLRNKITIGPILMQNDTHIVFNVTVPTVVPVTINFVSSENTTPVLTEHIEVFNIPITEEVIDSYVRVGTIVLNTTIPLEIKMRSTSNPEVSIRISPVTNITTDVYDIIRASKTYVVEIKVTKGIFAQKNSASITTNITAAPYPYVFSDFFQKKVMFNITSKYPRPTNESLAVVFSSLSGQEYNSSNKTTKIIIPITMRNQSIGNLKINISMPFELVITNTMTKYMKISTPGYSELKFSEKVLESKSYPLIGMAGRTIPLGKNEFDQSPTAFLPQEQNISVQFLSRLHDFSKTEKMSITLFVNDSKPVVPTVMLVTGNEEIPISGTVYKEFLLKPPQIFFGEIVIHANSPMLTPVIRVTDVEMKDGISRILILEGLNVVYNGTNDITAYGYPILENETMRFKVWVTRKDESPALLSVLMSYKRRISSTAYSTYQFGQIYATIPGTTIHKTDCIAGTDCTTGLCVQGKCAMECNTVNPPTTPLCSNGNLSYKEYGICTKNGFTKDFCTTKSAALNTNDRTYYSGCTIYQKILPVGSSCTTGSLAGGYIPTGYCNDKGACVPKTKVTEVIAPTKLVISPEIITPSKISPPLEVIAPSKTILTKIPVSTKLIVAE